MKHTAKITKNCNSLKVIIPLLQKPNNKHQLEWLEEKMLEIVDIVDDDINHPLSTILEIMGDHISEYESKNLPEVKSFTKPNELVKYMMQQNNLVQTDLAQIMGSQGNVSKFLTGKRKLTIMQVKALSKLFGISADALI